MHHHLEIALGFDRIKGAGVANIDGCIHSHSLQLGGLIVTETVFSVPGLGQYVVAAILNRDYPAAQGIVLILAGIVVLGNLFVDLLYGVIDPRTRVQAGEK